jgi:hypothetical protein
MKEKEFVPYDLALRLKALGFDEPCFGYHTNDKDYPFILDVRNLKDKYKEETKAPLYQQAFKWFRNNYSTHAEIHETTDWEEDNESWSFVIFKYRLGDNDGMISSTIDYKTYEEAELDCLVKLIEIVEKDK